MPPRWPRQPDRQDPEYRRLDDRMNLAFHIALFSATNSGIWFFRQFLRADWQWTTWLTLGWLTVVAIHAIYVISIANYSLTE
jgi:hypothetical protein